MKRIFTFLILLPLFVNAQSPVYDSLDINNINARFYSAGMMFTDTLNIGLGYEYPNGSGQSTIYAAGIWIGGLDQNDELHLAAQTYGQGKDFYPGPVSESWAYPQTHQDWNYVWKVTKDEIDLFQSYIPCILNPNCNLPNSLIPPVILNWPAHGDISKGQSQFIAPFVDYNSDGIYNPFDGDYPAIKGDMALFSVFNDDFIHTQTSGDSLRLEFRVMHYAYESLDSALANTIFSEYTMVNFSNQTYSDMYFGFWEDMDIGCAGDDYVGCDVEKSLGYMYNADSIDNSGCSGATPYLNTPAQGVIFLKGAKLISDGIDNNFNIEVNESINGCGFGDGIIDNERWGMSGFRYTNLNLPSYDFGAPNLPIEYYHFLKGEFNYINQFTGDTVSAWNIISIAGDTVHTNYYFPGYSDTSYYFGTNGIPVSPWSEVSENSPDGDRKIILSCGGFSMEPNEIQEFTIAHVTAMDASGTILGCVNLLQDYASQLISDYGCDEIGMYPNSPPLSISENELSTVNVSPNPTNGILNFKSEEKIERISVYSLLGKVILSKKVNGMSQIDISELPKGIYLIEFEFKSAEKSVKRIVKE